MFSQVHFLVLCLIPVTNLIFMFLSWQYLFDFIDVGRVVKPTTYRLVITHLYSYFSDVCMKMWFSYYVFDFRLAYDCKIFKLFSFEVFLVSLLLGEACKTKKFNYDTKMNVRFDISLLIEILLLNVTVADPIWMIDTGETISSTCFQWRREWLNFEWTWFD